MTAKGAERLYGLTDATDFLGIGIATRLDDTHAAMQEEVIRLILANHQRSRHGFASIRMMHNRTRRQRLPQRIFCSQNMKTEHLAVSRHQ
jgi:hypothetical protein